MIQQQTQIKYCLTCDKQLRGRTDKKFCDDYCRNSYNNQLKAITQSQVRDINSVLNRNRKIMGQLIPPGERIAKVSKEDLIQKGFLFKYITHMYTSNKGSTYYFCYEYGYLPLENDLFLIVKRNEEK